MTYQYDETVMKSGIANILLEFMQDNPNQWHKLAKLRAVIERNAPWVRDYMNVIRIFQGDGLKGLIKTSVRNLKLKGYPILSSVEKKGYAFLSADFPDAPTFWNEKFLANEKYRNKMSERERELDLVLFEKYLAKCKDFEIRNRLKKIAVEHGVSND